MSKKFLTLEIDIDYTETITSKIPAFKLVLLSLLFAVSTERSMHLCNLNINLSQRN